MAEQLVEVGAAMPNQVEVFSGSMFAFLNAERALILDGPGALDLPLSTRDCHVWVAAPDGELTRQLRWSRQLWCSCRDIKRYRPVLIGVDSAGDALRMAGHQPDVIVCTPTEVSARALTSGAQVGCPAHLDGYGSDMERIHDLTVGAVTSPGVGKIGGSGVACC